MTESHEEFFRKYGNLPVQFQTTVYGVQITIEELYQQFQARFYDEQFGRKSPSLQAMGGTIRRQPRARSKPTPEVVAETGDEEPQAEEGDGDPHGDDDAIPPFDFVIP